MPALLLLLLISLPVHSAELKVAVAANFKTTLEIINAGFEQASGHQVLLSSASTGVLHNQIRYGAPFELFFAADQLSATSLEAAGQAETGSSFCYAHGQLVLVGGELSALANPTLSLAIANASTAPYGRAAEQVLARVEFQQGNKRKLVRGANVAQTYAYWHSGNVDLALLPRAMAPGGSPVDSSWHDPIAQYATVLRKGANSAALGAYLQWIRSDTVTQQILDAGYLPCH
jgi:molybdate transport system substrate-binding protein